MANKKTITRPGCIERTLAVMGDKWTALILRDLTVSGSSFGELEKSLVGISPRTLSQRLDKLDIEGVIDKVLYCEHPPRYKYQLTQKGRELDSILTKMSEWGSRYTK